MLLSAVETARERNERMFRLDNQVCLVTGVGNPSGIGFGCAKQLGLAGGTIIITATTERIYDRVKELKALGIRQAEGYVINLCDRNAVAQMAAEIEEKYGKIDVLVNNAGNASLAEREKGDIHPALENMSYEEWDTIINRNLTLTYNVTKEVLKVMRKKRYGRIVFISSVTGPLVTHMGVSAYGAAKAGITALSKSIVYEEGKNNIISNCILPGWIATGVLTPDRLEAGSRNPLGRPGSPEEVGNLALYLSSKENSYVAGQDIVIDGGNWIQEMK